jgi:ATP-dependent exoDNAse (exonuclease V) beta subunit
MNTLPDLTLIPAGAGSGKTYRIKEQLADWVESGLVKPDRIAAVTFTEAAASELRERIRATLMTRGRLEDALRLDQSFISTIHGFGRRLLVEYAFEVGNCPTPRLLGEDEEKLLLRKAIARIDRIETISRKLYLFGYRYDFPSGTTDVEQFRQRILTAIHMLRIIGGDTDRHNRLNYCLDYIKQNYGSVDDARLLTASLRRSVQSLLAQYPDCMRDFVNSKAAIASVENDYRNLQRAARTDDLDENWGLWKRLQDLKVFKNDKQLPADYQQMAREIMTRAAELYRHTGPRDDAVLHCEVLLESAWDAVHDYAQRKREKGIIDYTDMIDGARLLLEQPDVLTHLAGRFDCLIIDEFQDTNPLQFSLLWKLHKAGVPALIVGDLKQSIMGFQSADPRLMGGLLSQHPDQCKPLNGNWRSQAKLMDVVNALGNGLFGPDYTTLKPMAPYESRLRPLEIICFEGKSITNRVRTQHVAARVKGLLSDDKMYVFDRHQNRHRQIRGEDIAILGMTHNRLTQYADALRELGIRVRLAQDGWFESRAVQLAFYGLSFVADPKDRHAALYLAVTELGEDDLTSAIQSLINGEALTLPLMQQLKSVSQQQDDLAVDELVVQTIEAMDLFDLAATWPEADQVRANLLRLIAEAQGFVAADREALAGGGYYGSGLKTFLSWIGSQLDGRDGDRQPEAQVHDEEAVQLLTWHSAKGKEWPVVIVTTFDRPVQAKLPSLDIRYTDFSDLDRILENARLVFSSDFVASETKDRFIEPLNEKAHTEGLNLLYVALTRAREQLILEWQSNLLTSSQYTYLNLLQDTAAVQLKANKLLIGGADFCCGVIAADKEPPVEFSVPAAESIHHLQTKGRRALDYHPTPEDLAPYFITPSSLHGRPEGASPVVYSTVQYGDQLELSLPPGADRGLLIHRALELLEQDVSADTAIELLGMPITDDDWTKIQSISASFTRHLQERFKPLKLHWEVPILSANRDRSVISGTVDLLVETADGYWIVDHKSDEPTDIEETFNHYLPQLECYAQALSEGMGLNVLGIAIHWTCLGAVSLSAATNLSGDQAI